MCCTRAGAMGVILRVNGLACADAGDKASGRVDGHRLSQPNPADDEVWLRVTEHDVTATRAEVERH